MHKKKTLVVAYDPAVAKLITRSLSGEKDIPPVTAVNNLDDARKELSTRLIAVVITDWTQVDGEEVVKTAQQEGVQKIIVINGGAVPEETVRTLGAINVPKPFTPQMIRDAVLQCYKHLLR